VNVDESEISYGVYLMLLAHNKVVEGSAGCAIATLLKEAPRFEGKTVVLVICGANVGVDNLKKIIDAHYNPMEN
jgi:threonine dehydratase